MIGMEKIGASRKSYLGTHDLVIQTHTQTNKQRGDSRRYITGKKVGQVVGTRS